MRHSPTILAALTLGCAPALSSFTPAHVTPHKHLQLETGIDVSLPSGSITNVIEVGKNLSKAAHEHELSEDEQTRLFRAGGALALNPPSAVTHLAGSYGLFKNFELGLRLAIGSYRLSARYQILKQDEDGVDLSAGLGGAHYSYQFPLSDQIPLIKLEDYSRWQVDLPLLVGKHGDWYRWWAGPRMLVGFYGTELNFEQPAIPGITGQKVVLASLDGTAWYLGGQLGGALGYKHLFFCAELTIVKFFTRANIKFLNDEHEVDVESTIYYPGFALMGEF